MALWLGTPEGDAAFKPWAERWFGVSPLARWRCEGCGRFLKRASAVGPACREFCSDACVDRYRSRLTHTQTDE